MEEKIMEAVTENVVEEAKEIVKNSNGKVVIGTLVGAGALTGAAFGIKKAFKWGKGKWQARHHKNETEDILNDKNLGEYEIEEEDAEKIREAIENEKN